MPDTNVLFVDMLGFAALLQDEGSSIDDLEPIYKSSVQFGPSPAPNILNERFINFHRCLNGARERLQRERTGTVIVFSDSAFFQSDAPTHILSVARSLMKDLIFHAVPARMGIARGSFRSLRYMSDLSAQGTYHVSQFLGTAVSRAVFAEKAGKGLRVFVDPSFGPWDLEMGRLSLPASTNAYTEFNYLSQIYRSAHADPGPEVQNLDAKLHDRLTQMMDSAETDDAKLHYTATYAAWNRMRLQAGMAPFEFQEFPTA